MPFSLKVMLLTIQHLAGDRHAGKEGGGGSLQEAAGAHCHSRLRDREQRWVITTSS